MYLDFGRKLIESESNGEDAILIMGSQDGIGPRYKKYIAAATHEFGHQSFSEFLFRRLLRKVSIEPRALFNFLDPYNELYADMIAVFVAGSPTILRDTIEDVDPREANSNQIPVRDFTALPKFKGWKHEPSVISNGYMMLDPVRGALWKLSMEHAQGADRAKVLQAFLNATEEHVLMRLKRGERDESPAAAELLNREFLRLYVNHARALGLKLK